MKSLIIKLFPLSLLMISIACGEKEKEITVQSIAISQPSAEMVIGETLNLKASISPSNATYDGITWTSTKTSVATVSGSGQVSALAEGNTTITAMAGGKTAACAITVVKGYVGVSSISLNKDSIELVEGDSETLTATVSPDDATDKTVSWTSSNTGVATVKDGTITAVKEGEATITAKAGEKSTLCRVIVSRKVTLEAIDLGLSVKWASVNLGATIPEEYGDYYAWGEIIPYYSSLSPLVWLSGKEAGYTPSSYRWCRGTFNTLTKYCSDPSYGYNGFTDYKTTLEPEDDAAFAQLGDKWRTPTISEIEELLNKCSWVWTSINGVKGYRVTGPTRNSIFLPAAGFWYEKLLDETGISGLYWSSSVFNGAGRSFLDLSSDYKGRNDGLGFYCGLSIRPVYGAPASSVSVQSVSLDKSQLNLTVGQTYTLTATVTPSNASNKSVTWSSSNTSVATVSSSGVVSAKAAGNATITVKTNDGGKTATCTVRVSAATIAVTGISLNKTSLSMNVGDTQTLTATVSPSNATNKSVTWSSSNTGIATVSSSGTVTAISAGNALITVKTNDGGYSADCSVTVADAPYTVAVPEAVDLGLSVKWASFNLGATNPKEPGDYFAWGEIEPYYSSLDPLTWKPGKESGYTFSSYKWGGEYELRKYCDRDGKTSLDMEDDAAYVLLGGKWRMPTYKEVYELLHKCVWERKWISGDHCFYYEITGPSGNSIILRPMGALSGKDLVNYECSEKYSISGCYWIKNLGSDERKAYVLHTYAYNKTGTRYIEEIVQYSRCCGYNIRPVYDD